MENIITKSMVCSAIAIIGFSAITKAQCPNFTYYPINQAIGWNSSEYYKVIDLDAATLTDAAKYPRTGAIDGQDDNVDYEQNILKSPTGDGNITVPLYNPAEEKGQYVPSGYNYDIKFVRCVFAPDHYTSALTKDDNGMLPSGNTNACTINDNTCLVGNVYGKQGFIELSRQAASAGEPANSKCGYIQLDNLYGVERIQWSYSSTSWKRGVICEIRLGGEGAEWLPQRIIPSETNAYATFSEQGYEFEELINHRRSIKRCFRTLVPIAAETVMLLNQVSPIISLMANTTIQFGIKKFCKEKEIQIGKDNAYLLCAWREGMIQ